MIKVLILLTVYTLPNSDLLLPPNYYYISVEEGISTEVVCTQAREFSEDRAVEHEKQTGSRLVFVGCWEMEYTPFKVRKPANPVVPLIPYTPTETFVLKIPTYNRYNYSNHRQA